MLAGTICYLLLNNIKIRAGSDFGSCANFLWLSLLLPLNLLVFYFLPTTKLKENRNFLLLLISLAEISLTEKYGHFISDIPLGEATVGTLPLLQFSVWFVVLLIIGLEISFKSAIVSTGIFYADLALFTAFIYADSSSACTTFFLAFCVILSTVAVLDLRNLYRNDYLEGVGSYQSYISQAERKFPFKYTIGLLCIDNIDQFITQFGWRKINILEQMIVNRLKEFPYEIEIFRHERNELILVFKNETAKHVTEYAEDIRRTLAGSEFIFNRNESTKLSVSICVSEKTRKDINAAEVINRAHNTLQKANSLNCNIVVKA